MDVVARSLEVDGAPVIFGLDPGRDKVGWALTDEAGDLCLSGIIPTAGFDFLLSLLRERIIEEEALRPWILERRTCVQRGELQRLALGDGTSSHWFVNRLVSEGIDFSLVNERGTTLEARVLYWKLHKPSLWRRLLPRSLWVPPRPVDDLAAWAIVLRALSKEKPSSAWKT